MRAPALLVVLLLAVISGSRAVSLSGYLLRSGYAQFANALAVSGADKLVNSAAFSAKSNTIFVPTDGAFLDMALKLNPLFPDRPLKSRRLMLAIVRYHLIPSTSLSLASLRKQKVLTSRLNANLRVLTRTSKDPNIAGTYVEGATNRAKVTFPDIGPRSVRKVAMHEVDEVLIPQFAYPGCATPATTLNNTGLYLFHAAMARSKHRAIFSNNSFSGTFFIPNNDVFVEPMQRLHTTINDIDAVNAFIAKNAAWLDNIMLNHVIPERVYASQLADGLQFTTLRGKTITIKSRPGGRWPETREDFRVQGPRSTAWIRLADNYACNAVVHVIDNWLLA